MGVLEECIELVKIDSDSRMERCMVDALTKKLTDIGCDVWEDRNAAEKVGGNAGNLYAELLAQQM